MAALSQLQAHADCVDRRLAELLLAETVRPEPLHQAMRYSCLAPGKRLRPALCMAAAEAVGGDPLSVLDAGCAIEMVHCFSLIHDDLPAIDNDDLRRGVPTCHKKFGEATAILAGDALFARAFEVLSNGPWAPKLAIKAIQSLCKATGSEGLVGGETVDILSEGKPVDVETLRYIHANKTGALIAASCQIGATLADGDGLQVQKVYQYGVHVGLAFQIVDDILNETSTAEELGKAAGTDRERQKATYPALFGIEESRREAKRLAELAVAQLEDLAGPTTLLTELAIFTVERLN